MESESTKVDAKVENELNEAGVNKAPDGDDDKTAEVVFGDDGTDSENDLEEAIKVGKEEMVKDEEGNVEDQDLDRNDSPVARSDSPIARSESPVGVEENKEADAVAVFDTEENKEPSKPDDGRLYAENVKNLFFLILMYFIVNGFSL